MEMNDKKELLKTLQTAVGVLREADGLHENCCEIEEKIDVLKQDMSKYKMSWAILSILASPIILITLIGGVGGGSAGYILFSIALIIVAGILIYFDIQHDKTRRARLSGEIGRREDDLKASRTTLNTYIANNFKLVMEIPERYRYYHAVSCFVDYISSSRSDTLKEAINLYEEEMHRKRMEMGQQELLAMQKEQQRTLDSINQYAASINRQAGVNNFLTSVGAAASISAASSLNSINKKLD